MSTNVNSNANAQNVQNNNTNANNAQGAPEHRIPPVLKDCEEYRRATGAGKVTSQSRKCKYSLMYIDNKDFSICSSISEFATLGTGYPLFFDLVKVIAIFLFILAIPAGYLCYHNYQGNDCVQRQDMKVKKAHGRAIGGLNGFEISQGTETFKKSGNLGQLGQFGHRLLSKLRFGDGGSSEASHALGADYNRFSDSVETSDSLLAFYISVYCRYKWYDFNDKDCRNFVNKKCHKYIGTDYTPTHHREAPKTHRFGINISTSYQVSHFATTANNAAAEKECKTLAKSKFKKVSKRLACLKTITNQVSLANWGDLSNDSKHETQLLNSLFKEIDAVAIMVLLALMAIFLTFYNRRQANIYDAEVLSIEDFSVMLRGLPFKEDLKGNHNLKDALKREIEILGGKVAQINFVYDTDEYIKLRKEYEKLAVEYLKRLWKKGQKDLQGQSEVTLLKNAGGEVGTKSTQLLNRMKQLEDEFESGSTKHLAGKAFVSFESYSDAHNFLRERRRYNPIKSCWDLGDAKFRRGDIDLTLEGKTFYIYADKPREPNDIIWENQSVSIFKKILIWFGYIFMEILIVGVGFTLVCFLQVGFNNIGAMLEDRKNQTPAEETLELVVDYLGGIVIVVIDEILEWLIGKMADFSRPRTFTEKHKIIASTLWKLQFLNNAIIPLLYSWTILNFFGRNGLVEKMNSVLMASIFMTPILKIFLDKDNIWKGCKIRAVKNFIKTGKGIPYTQKEANEVFEKEAWGISKNYASVIKSFMVAIFYLPLIPLSVFYNLFYLLVFYWVTKYDLVKRSNKIFRFTNQISQQLIPEFKWSLLVFTLGLILEQFIMQFMNLREIELSEFLLFSLFAVLIFPFIDIDLFIKPCVPRKAEKNALAGFQVAKRQNVQDYDFMNPATSRRARQKDGEFNAVFYKKDNYENDIVGGGGGLLGNQNAPINGGQQF